MNRKKLYEKPAMQVVQVQMTQILCNSVDAEVNQMGEEENW